MPTNYALRTPIYASTSSSTTGIQSAKLLLNITGQSNPVYTIIKQASSSTTVQFEIAELLRDYLNITYTYTPQKITFTSTIQFFDAVNGGGSAVGSAVSTTSGDAFEAFGLFTDGINPILPFEGRTRPTWLLQVAVPNTPVTSYDDYYVFAPVGHSGTVTWIAYDGTVSAATYNTTDTSIQPSGAINLNIVRIDCTKYGEGRMVSFINKYGVMQDLWFFLKRVKNINRTNESYQSNTLTNTTATSTPSYSETDAPKKLFNTQAKQTNTLSSGYYPEWSNSYFEELLLSEYVWLTRPKVNSAASTPLEETIPVIVKTSSMIYKTSLNDRLIEYTIEFEDAFDYINNIR